MHREWFSRDLDQLGDADVTHVQTLAKRYRTSLEATCNRYTDLTPDICAFVFAKDSVIRYVRPTTSFPRLAVKTGDRLPAGCASLRAPAQPFRIASPWTEVDGSIWLWSEWGSRSPMILEQTVRQSGGFQVSLLFIDASALEEKDEEATLDKSWEVQFRR
jgi:hypothetical protein